MACKTGQLGLCIDIYKYIYILYLVELSSFLPCLFLQHLSKAEMLSWAHRRVGSGRGRAAGLGLQLYLPGAAEDRGNSPLGSSGP